MNRGTRARLAYFRDFAERHGCTYAQANVVADRAERWMERGVYMNTDRLLVECKLARRHERKAA